MRNLQQSFKKIILIPLLLLFVYTAHSQASIEDEVIKRNITLINNPLNKLLLLEPRTFEYNTERFKTLGLKQGKQFGFLTDNINEIFPALVSSKTVSYMYGKNNYRQQTYQTIDEVSLIPVMVASIQELHNEIEQLKRQVAELKK